MHRTNVIQTWFVIILRKSENCNSWFWIAGLTAAVNLVDEGHEVEIYESRSFWGGKVGSWEDKDGNHIEMGLHVFFYNYANLFKLMQKVGALDNLMPKDHTHLFINNGGNLKSIDFRFN